MVSLITLVKLEFAFTALGVGLEVLPRPDQVRALCRQVGVRGHMARPVRRHACPLTCGSAGYPAISMDKRLKG